MQLSWRGSFGGNDPVCATDERGVVAGEANSDRIGLPKQQVAAHVGPAFVQ